jgi:ClpP class serine protease
MKPAKVARIAQGRIYTGLGGLRNGLVDEIGGLWDAIVLAKEAAGLPPSSSISILEGPDLGALPENFFRPQLTATRDPFDTVGGVVGEDAEALVSLADRPEFFASIFSLEQWAAMSVAERAWMRQVFLTPRQPITMMEPFNIDW